MVWEPIAPVFEAPQWQFRTAIANRQHFSPNTSRLTMFGREEFKPSWKAYLGIEALLFMMAP